MEEIPERQLPIRGGAFVTFCAIEEALTVRKKNFPRPDKQLSFQNFWP